MRIEAWKVEKTNISSFEFKIEARKLEKIVVLVGVIVFVVTHAPD